MIRRRLAWRTVLKLWIRNRRARRQFINDLGVQPMRKLDIDAEEGNRYGW
jgi:hypothetical protein